MYTHIYNILNKYAWFVSTKYACFVCVLHTHLEGCNHLIARLMCLPHILPPRLLLSGGLQRQKRGFLVSLVTSGDAVVSGHPGCPLLPSPGAEQELFGPGDQDRSEPQLPRAALRRCR